MEFKAKQAILMEDGQIEITINQADGTSKKDIVSLVRKDFLFGYAEINAATAKYLLEHNHPNQRTKKGPKHVNNYKNQMLNNQWNIAQPLMFSVDGYLVDGQNRLHALIAAQNEMAREGKMISIKFSIALGIASSALSCIDAGAARTPVDRVKLDGYEFPADIKSGAAMDAIKRISGLDKQAYKPTNAQLKQAAIDFGEPAIFQIMRQIKKQKNNVTNACIIAAIGKVWVSHPSRHDEIKTLAKTFFSGCMPESTGGLLKSHEEMVKLHKDIFNRHSLRGLAEQQPAMDDVEFQFEVELDKNMLEPVTYMSEAA